MRCLVKGIQYLEKQRNSLNLNSTLSTHTTSHQSTCFRVNNVLKVQAFEILTPSGTCEEVVKRT